MMKKDILLTFDYELFFNISGSVEKCILEPTDRLIDIFDKYHIRATFFVDVLYYIRLKEDCRTFNDSLLIKTQLQRLVRAGHRIELHLHPHWLDAIFNGNSWEFPTYDNYRLHNLAEDAIVDLFKKGKFVLEEIAQEVDNNYRIIAYRAGGFCIQPFDKLRRCFIECDIKIDSSVVEGFYGNGVAHKFDFRGAPHKEYYRFSNDVLQIDPAGNFVELPLRTFKFNFTGRIYNKILTSGKKNNIFGDGLFISLGGGSRVIHFVNRFKLINKFYSLEFFSKSLIVRKIRNYRGAFLVLLSHPKTISLESFDIISQLANDGNEFLNISDWYKKYVLI